MVFLFVNVETFKFPIIEAKKSGKKETLTVEILKISIKYMNS